MNVETGAIHANCASRLFKNLVFRSSCFDLSDGLIYAPAKYLVDTLKGDFHRHISAAQLNNGLCRQPPVISILLSQPSSAALLAALMSSGQRPWTSGRRTRFRTAADPMPECWRGKPARDALSLKMAQNTHARLPIFDAEMQGFSKTGTPCLIE